MNITQTPSPNFDSRDSHIVDMLVLHYTGMKTANDALERMCDSVSKVSAHYMVDVDGKVLQLVPEEMRAWHAGVSFWRGNTNINQRSIGIEIVNAGHEFGYTKFPDAQMQSVSSLCLGIIKRYNIPARNIVAHSDIAPTRKQDPGELFDWEWLAERGVGVFPSLTAPSPTGGGAGWGLEEYGYDITDLPAAIIAFQRRFRPHDISGIWDDECAKLLASLIFMV